MKKIAFVFVAAIVASVSMSMSSCKGGEQAQDTDSVAADTVDTTVVDSVDTVATDSAAADSAVAPQA